MVKVAGDRTVSSVYNKVIFRKFYLGQWIDIAGMNDNGGISLLKFPNQIGNCIVKTIASNRNPSLKFGLTVMPD